MEFDAARIQAALVRFLGEHRTALSRAVNRHSQLLELGALTLSAEHYKRRGYTITPANLIRNRFRVKLSASGYPKNFSWFCANKHGLEFQIHANLPIQSYHDEGIYVVDVGVVVANKMPDSAKKYEYVKNETLVTFVEAKKLVIYPMLIAQFIGIVHEIKPQFIGGRRPRGFLQSGHFDPALVAIGYIHERSRSRSILNGFSGRGIKVNVIPKFDWEISRFVRDPNRDSPFGPPALRDDTPQQDPAVATGG